MVLDPGRGRTKKGYFWAVARVASGQYRDHYVDHVGIGSRRRASLGPDCVEASCLTRAVDRPGRPDDVDDRNHAFP